MAQSRAVIDVVGAESRCAPVSGTDRPPRSSPLRNQNRPAPSRPSRRGFFTSPLAAMSSASSQLASRKCVKGLAGIDLVVGILLRVRQPHQRLCQRCG
jgi:hypothetical protein